MRCGHECILEPRIGQSPSMHGYFLPHGSACITQNTNACVPPYLNTNVHPHKPRDSRRRSGGGSHAPPQVLNTTGRCGHPNLHECYRSRSGTTARVSVPLTFLAGRVGLAGERASGWFDTLFNCIFARSLTALTDSLGAAHGGLCPLLAARVWAGQLVSSCVRAFGQPRGLRCASVVRPCARLAAVGVFEWMDDRNSSVPMVHHPARHKCFAQSQ